MATCRQGRPRDRVREYRHSWAGVVPPGGDASLLVTLGSRARKCPRRPFPHSPQVVRHGRKNLTLLLPLFPKFALGVGAVGGLRPSDRTIFPYSASEGARVVSRPWCSGHRSLPSPLVAISHLPSPISPLPGSRARVRTGPGLTAARRPEGDSGGELVRAVARARTFSPARAARCRSGLHERNQELWPDLSGGAIPFADPRRLSTPHPKRHGRARPDVRVLVGSGRRWPRPNDRARLRAARGLVGGESRLHGQE